MLLIAPAEFNVTIEAVELTLTRPIGLPPHTPVAHKIANQRYFDKKKVPFFYKNILCMVG